MDGKAIVSIPDYYAAAIPRSLWAGWDWAVGRGLLLIILLALASLAWATGYAAVRALRRRHSWDEAIKEVGRPALLGRVAGDFAVAGLGAMGIILIILFGVFFIKDAPTQLSSVNQKIQDWQQAWETQAMDDQQIIAALQNNYREQISAFDRQLRPDIGHSVSVVQLQSNLDPNNKANTLEIRPLIASQKADTFHYKLQKATLRYPDRTISFGDDRDYVIRPGAIMTYFPERGLSAKEFDKLEKATIANLECEILYGVAGHPYDRRAIKIFRVTIFKKTVQGKPTATLRWVIESEKDEKLS